MGSYDEYEKLNKDTKRRAELLDIVDGEKTFGGSQRYSELSYKNLQALVMEGFANEGEIQNDAPSIGEFLDYMIVHPWVTAHGYAIIPERSDYRVSVEGLEGYTDNIREVVDFLLWNKYADELDANEQDGTWYCRSWWD